MAFSKLALSTDGDTPKDFLLPFTRVPFSEGVGHVCEKTLSERCPASCPERLSCNRPFGVDCFVGGHRPHL